MTNYIQIEFADFHCWTERRGHSTDRVCEIFVRFYETDLRIVRKDPSLKRAALQAISMIERRVARKTGKRLPITKTVNPRLYRGYS